MRIILLIVSNGLVIGGAGILALSLMPFDQLISLLPAGALKQRWRVIKYLICLSIFGYIAFAVVSWSVSPGIRALIVPMFLFVGAAFVLVVGRLALQTVSDVKKMAALEPGNFIDTLTGTHNRRYFDHCLANEMGRARRYWLPLSIMMFDIDGLEKVNHSHGHKAGDRVLMHLGRLLLEAVRNTDIVARYGEDEFAIITPHTRLPDAHDLAERLRLKVEHSPVSLSDTATNGDALGITVSIGVASLFEGVTNAEALMRLADDALRIAKKSGRNQVVVCGQTRTGMETPERSISIVAVNPQ